MARKEMGLSRSQLARLASVTSSSISNYENGISVPRDKTLRAILLALGIDANYLYQDDIPPVSPDALLPEISDYISKYRALDERGRDTVNSILDIEYSRAAKPGA